MWSPEPEPPWGWGHLLEHPHSLPLLCPLQSPAFAPSSWDTDLLLTHQTGDSLSTGPRVRRAGHSTQPL